MKSTGQKLIRVKDQRRIRYQCDSTAYHENKICQVGYILGKKLPNSTMNTSTTVSSRQYEKFSYFFYSNITISPLFTTSKFFHKKKK